jgi:ABC-2 type transport system ATP-binding protein
MTTEVVIRTEGLVKDYGQVRALDGVDLEVRRGEVFGFIGPNGAGKSTTIRVLLDLLRPTAGHAEVFGLTPANGGAELRQRIGYLPGELHLSGRVGAGTLLTRMAHLRGGRGADRVAPLAERFGLDLDRPVRSLSKGNRQKVGVVQAFMHDPDLLVLDEPTSGLDPLLQREFLDLVTEATDRGATVFMSSHVLSEVEEVAGRSRSSAPAGSSTWMMSTSCVTGPASRWSCASTSPWTSPPSPDWPVWTVHVSTSVRTAPTS